MAKLSVYAKFGRLTDKFPSLVEGDSDLKLLAEIYALYSAKKIKKNEIGWKIAYPIARFPELRKLFS